MQDVVNRGRHSLATGMTADAREDAIDPGVAAIWRAALHTLSAQSAPILLCAFGGVAGVYILAQLINTALTFDVYFRAGGVYPAYSNTYYAQLLIQASIGTFTVTLARGAITWLTLRHAAGERAGLREALRAAARRLPILLLSTLTYGLLIFLGLAGVTLLLRQMRLDMTSIGRVTTDFDSITHLMAARVVNGFLPDPGAPFAEVVSFARYFLRRSTSNYYWLYAFGIDAGGIPARVLLIGLAGIVPMVAAGTFIRLRFATIMGADAPNRYSALTEAMRIGARNFTTLLKHGALLWLAGSGLNIVFVAVPLSLSQYLLVPALSQRLNALWPYPASAFLFTLSQTLVSMLLIAFTTVYDAHLCAALARAHREGSR